MKLGGIYVDITGKTTGLKKDLSQAEGMVDRSSKDMQSTIGRISFAQIGVAALAFAGTYAYAMKKSIDAASDLQEVQGKFDVVFKGQEKVAEDWSKTLVKSYMLSEREAKQYLSSVQDLLVPMGMQSEAAAKMSNEVVKLSADLGSFNNLPTAQVMGDIQSALVGNFETMKKYGVVLNETVVFQKALDMGLVSNKNEMNANIKAQVAYKLMLEGSAAAVGDADRTSENYANQMKKLMARFEDIKAVIGDQVLPVVTQFIQEMNAWIDNNPDSIKALAELAASWVKVGAAIAKVVVDIITYSRFYAIGSTVKNGKFAPSIVPKGIGLPDRIENPGNVEVYDASESAKAVIAANNAKVVSVKDFVKAGSDIGADIWLDYAKGSEEAGRRAIQMIGEQKEAVEDFTKDSNFAIKDMWLDHAKGSEEAGRRAIQMLGKQESANDKMWATMDTVTEAGARSMETSLSGFINPLSDKFTDLGDLWKSVTQSMSASFADAVAKMAVDWVVAGPSSWATIGGALSTGWGAVSGGASSLWDTVAGWFGTGAWNIEKDQIAGLHAGEMVIPKSVADAFRNSGNADRQPPSSVSTGGWAGIGDLISKGPAGLIAADMGMDSAWAQKGVNVGSVLGGLLAPSGGIIGGGLGGVIGEALADYANNRSLEVMRDLHEELNGWFSSHKSLREVTALPGYLAGYVEDRFTGGGASSGPSPGGRGHEAMGGFGSGPGFKYGGIARGPESGYSAKLHGTELVVSPKRDVPVKMGGGPMNINLHLDGKVIAKWLFDYTKGGHKSVHGRGIVYG
jgi:hypothetical protein